MPSRATPKPIIILNLKTYPEGTGKNAISIAKLCEQMAKAHKRDIRVAVQPTDLAPVANAVKIPVYAQHVDPAPMGKSTGWITAHAVKVAGGSGTLLNHSEHRLSTKEIESAAAHCRKEGLAVVICAESIARLGELQHIDADAFAVEPPELIGGDISISVAQPQIIEAAVKASRKPLLIGAGVKDHRDVEIGLKLGAKGVLLASGIVLAKDQKAAFEKLLEE